MTAARTSYFNTRGVFITLVLLFCVLFISGRISMGNSRKARPSKTGTSRSSLPLPPQNRLHVQVTKVSDGDTIKVVAADYSDFDGELRVRLRYIDTPETKQPYGPEATQYLKALLDGRKKVTISFEEYDMYNRALGVVYYGRRNVNRLLIENGFAWCYRNRCPSSYATALKSAQEARRGLWAQRNPQSPWEYRSERRGGGKTRPSKAATSRSSLPLPPQNRLHVQVTKVTDGDTIKVVAGDHSDFDGEELRVRFRYIDTPETKQPYGPEATQYLKALLDGGKKVTISFEEYDMYNRALGVVYYGGQNVNSLLLENGFAWCYRNRCPSSYATALKSAQAARRGLWAQSNPQSPWEYRSELRKAWKRKRNEL